MLICPWFSCLSLGDAFFKAAVTALKEVPQYMGEREREKRKGGEREMHVHICTMYMYWLFYSLDMDHRRQSTEGFAQSFFCNLFSTLLVIPVSYHTTCLSCDFTCY